MKCEFIGCDNEVENKGQRFCSKSCGNLNRWGAKDKRGRIISKVCSYCNTKWEVRRSDLNRQNNTCSDTCHRAAKAAAHRGKIVSKETRRKQSEAMSGRKLTKEHREAIGRGVAGSRNSRWIDGRSRDKEGAADYNFEFTCTLRTTIKKRDGHQCRDAIFEHNWLDIEDIYRQAGWAVEYNAPAYNETFDETFKFSRNNL
jgi:hypothetical protein